MKKIEIKGLEGAELDFANQHNSMIDAIEAKEVSINELEKKLAALEAIEVKSYDKEVLELKNAMLTLENEIAKKSAGAPEQKSLRQTIIDEIKALGVNNVAELKSYIKKNGTQELEIKAITAIASTANTDTVGRTNLDNRVAWAPVDANAFLQNFRTVAEQSDKSKFGYVEGSYTGAAAYVGEGVGNPDSDAATAAASFGDLSPISILPPGKQISPGCHVISLLRTSKIRWYSPSILTTGTKTAH